MFPVSITAYSQAQTSNEGSIQYLGYNARENVITSLKKSHRKDRESSNFYIWLTSMGGTRVVPNSVQTLGDTSMEPNPILNVCQ